MDKQKLKKWIIELVKAILLAIAGFVTASLTSCATNRVVASTTDWSTMDIKISTNQTPTVTTDGKIEVKPENNK